jgi:hypothetical protein
MGKEFAELVESTNDMVIEVKSNEKAALTEKR